MLSFTRPGFRTSPSAARLAAPLLFLAFARPIFEIEWVLDPPPFLKTHPLFHLVSCRPSSGPLALFVPFPYSLLYERPPSRHCHVFSDPNPSFGVRWKLCPNCLVLELTTPILSHDPQTAHPRLRATNTPSAASIPRGRRLHLPQLSKIPFVVLEHQ